VGGDAEVTEEDGETMWSASKVSAVENYVQDGVYLAVLDKPWVLQRAASKLEGTLGARRESSAPTRDDALALFIRIPTHLSTRNLPARNICTQTSIYIWTGHRTRASLIGHRIMTNE